jgi:uncharacterized peroxidase-related enzyme
MGILPRWVACVAEVPWIPRAFAVMNQTPLAHMAPLLRELIALVVSQDQSCRYCYGMTRAMLRVLGYSDDLVDRLERDLQLADLDRHDQRALEFARRVSKANPRPRAAEIDALRAAGFTRPAIAEIAYVAAVNVCSNRLATLLSLPPEPVVRWVEHPLGRIVRPLAAVMLRPRRARPESLPRNEGPCAEVVAALEGAPAARVLRGVIDDAMASPVLPRRTKLLMLAVIGRALGCAHSEAGARTGLRDDGMDAAALDDLLANLGSPQLDARDALLVPFARETVRYRNTDIQQRTRALRDRLSVVEAVEAVGIASLANGICRLSVLLDAC